MRYPRGLEPTTITESSTSTGGRHVSGAIAESLDIDPQTQDIQNYLGMKWAFENSSPTFQQGLPHNSSQIVPQLWTKH